MAVKLSGIAIAVICLQGAFAHVCLIVPRQRGEMDISQAGSPTCARHGDPCGGQPAQTPTFTAHGGSPLMVKWQQNFNYYTTGFPGYMDVAIGNLSATQPSDFQQLAVVGDRYVYSRAHQENFTAVVTVPDMACDHCVLRLRYNSHKQGESIFIQCADIRVIPSSLRTKTGTSHLLASIPPSDPEHKVFQKLAAMDNVHARAVNISGDIFGFAYDIWNKAQTYYVRVDLLTGERIPIIEYGLDLDIPVSAYYLKGLAIPVPYISNAVAAVDPTRDVILMIMHAPYNHPDNVPGMFAVFGAHNGTVLKVNGLQLFRGPAVIAIIYDYDDGFITVGMNETVVEGVYEFVLGRLDVWGTSAWSLLMVPQLTEGVYVNFLWAEYDAENKFFYLLMGKENDPEGLSARIFTFDLGSRTIYAYADVQNTQYTIRSMQYYAATGQLYALSPGLHNASYPAYALVKIDPLRGTVEKLCDVSPPGIFERYYGGTIFNGLEQTTGKLQHVLRVGDTAADFIVSVDVDTCTADYSQIVNLHEVYNLVHVRPSAAPAQRKPKI